MAYVLFRPWESLPTLGVIGLAIPLQGEKMIDGIMRPHVHIYTCEALLINDDTGPKCTLLSSVQFEQMGYTWESSRTICTLTAPDGTKIHLTRNRFNGFWYFNAIKRHHGAELTRKEMAIPALQVNITLFTVDTHDEIQKVKCQLSTDNCQTADSKNKSESFATID